MGRGLATYRLRAVPALCDLSIKSLVRISEFSENPASNSSSSNYLQIFNLAQLHRQFSGLQGSPAGGDELIAVMVVWALLALNQWKMLCHMSICDILDLALGDPLFEP